MFSFQFFILLVRSFSSSFISVCVFVSDFFSFYSNFWTSFNFLFSYLCSMVFIKEDIKKIYVKLLFWSLCLVFQLNFFLQDILQIRFLTSGGCILSWLFIFLFFFWGSGIWSYYIWSDFGVLFLLCGCSFLWLLLPDLDPSTLWCMMSLIPTLVWWLWGSC